MKWNGAANKVNKKADQTFSVSVPLVLLESKNKKSNEENHKILKKRWKLLKRRGDNQ